MSRYSIAQRTPLINSLFAGLACAITLTLAAGPALADTVELGRVEVRGRVVEGPVRYDVRESCAGFDAQLKDTLDKTWARSSVYGEVRVEYVIENGRVEAVKARSPHGELNGGVRSAVWGLSCGQQASAGAQIYRFTVDFVNPDSPSRKGETQMAGAQPVAVVSVARIND